MKKNLTKEELVNIKKGEIYYIDLNGVIGSEQGGIRPCLIIQNNKGNTYSPTTIISPLTTQLKHANRMPTHISIVPNDENGLKESSVVMLEHIRTIDKTRIIKKIGNLNKEEINNIDDAIKISLSI